MDGQPEAKKLKISTVKGNESALFCKLYDHRFTKRFNLIRHLESIHGGTRYSCDQCEYSAKEIGNPKRHKEVMTASDIPVINVNMSLSGSVT